jgi:hypothetical protein
MENPLRYDLLSVIVYELALLLTFVACFGSNGSFPVELRQNNVVIQLSLFMMLWALRIPFTLSILGFKNIYLIKDWFPHFFLLVLVSLERMSALVLYVTPLK